MAVIVGSLRSGWNQTGSAAMKSSDGQELQPGGRTRDRELGRTVEEKPDGSHKDIS